MRSHSPETAAAPAPGPQAEEISLLILRQKSARAAMRLELFLPPQLKPTRIPDPLNRQEVPASPGRGGEGPLTASLQPWSQLLSPAAEARRDHPGGESRWQHLPTLTMAPRCATAHIKLSCSESLLVLMLPLQVPGEGGERTVLPLPHQTSGTEWGSPNQVGRC